MNSQSDEIIMRVKLPLRKKKRKDETCTYIVVKEFETVQLEDSMRHIFP